MTSESKPKVRTIAVEFRTISRYSCSTVYVCLNKMKEIGVLYLFFFYFFKITDSHFSTKVTKPTYLCLANEYPSRLFVERGVGVDRGFMPNTRSTVQGYRISDLLLHSPGRHAAHVRPDSAVAGTAEEGAGSWLGDWLARCASNRY